MVVSAAGAAPRRVSACASTTVSAGASSDPAPYPARSASRSGRSRSTAPTASDIGTISGMPLPGDGSSDGRDIS